MSKDNLCRNAVAALLSSRHPTCGATGSKPDRRKVNFEQRQLDSFVRNQPTPCALPG